MNEFSAGMLVGISAAVPFLVSRKWAATFALNLLIGFFVYAFFAGSDAVCALLKSYIVMAAKHGELAAGLAAGFGIAALLRVIFGLSRE